ncbi:MAG: hypothetical protein HS126_21590 [Anaerolineales bacterium]|nr:hypothetical protein [Anaerolineales bacterium]
MDSDEVAQRGQEKTFDKSTAWPLIGHTSQETAFVQPDYPYGRRLRCQRRVWVETKKGHGQRFVTQTSNPKWHGATVKWNTPHASTYTEGLIALWIDDKGYIATDRVSAWTDLEAMKAWGERNAQLLQADDYAQQTYAIMLAAKEAYQKKLEAGEVKFRVETSEYVPDVGLVKTSEKIVTARA